MQSSKEPIEDPNQSGGKLLGQGLYGCVFDKPLACTDGMKRNRKRKGNEKGRGSVGKLSYADTIFPLNEIMVGDVLSTIPNYDSYFIVATELCTPKPRAKQTEPDLKLCEIAQSVPLPSMKQLIMPMGGKTLRLVPKTMANIDLFGMIQHLLEAGTLLLTKHIVHADLHMMNILVDGPSRAQFIDFGLSWSPDLLTYSNVGLLDRQFNPAITQEPPEVSYIQGMLDKLPPRVILGRIEDQKLVMKLVAQFFGRSKEGQMARLRRFISESESFIQFNRYSYYKLYWSKNDAWAIGTVCMTLLADMLSMTDLVDTNEYQERHEVLEKVIVGLLDPDASIRLDAAEALELFAPSSSILRRADVKEWLREQHTLRKELQKILS